jgi:hypothetical protein
MVGNGGKASGPTTAPPAPPARASKPEIARRAGEAAIALGKMKPTFTAPRIVLNGCEGVGKTSVAAFSPNPAILMAAGETGYETLLGSGLVPSVDAAHVKSWPMLLELLDKLGDVEKPSHQVLAFDALGGFERLCHEHVCQRDFNGEWGERGFASYQKGYDLAVTDWLQFLQRLDRIRVRGVTILMLGHVQVRPFKNPLGADYDRYVCDVHHKTWGVTHKWADAVLFYAFRTILNEKKGTKPKGIGHADRVLYCERRDAYDAKNRYGMPEQVDIPNEPDQVWGTIWTAITAHKEAHNATPAA